MVNVECYAHQKYLLKLKMKTLNIQNREKFIINRPALKDTFKKSFKRRKQEWIEIQIHTKEQNHWNGDNVGQHTRFFYYSISLKYNWLSNKNNNGAYNKKKVTCLTILAQTERREMDATLL